MNQAERIVEFMELYGGITQSEASQFLGCTRLAARIKEIKDQGYSVKTTMIHSKNRFGEPTHYAKYSLEAER